MNMSFLQCPFQLATSNAAGKAREAMQQRAAAVKTQPFSEQENVMWLWWISQIFALRWSSVTDKYLTWKTPVNTILQDVNNGCQKCSFTVYVNKKIMVAINPLIIISGSTKLVPLAPWYSHFVGHLRVTSWGVFQKTRLRKAGLLLNDLLWINQTNSTRINLSHIVWG